VLHRPEHAHSSEPIWSVTKVGKGVKLLIGFIGLDHDLASYPFEGAGGVVVVTG
jgi:hypothetical protein